MHALSRLLPRRLAAATIAVATLAGAAPAIAAYPERPINLVVPMPPGGGTDVVSRLLAERLGVATGWNLEVQNKPGATGNIATEDLVYLLSRSGIDTGLALDPLIEVAGLVGERLGAPPPSLLPKAGGFPAAG